MKRNLFIIISLCIFLRSSAQEKISASIPFAINSAIISDIEKKHISNLVTSYPIEKVQLTGHTDNIGNNGYNLELSKRRVQAVSDYLVQLGISPTIIQQSYYGEAKPIESNENDLGKSLNRRVEMQVFLKISKQQIIDNQFVTEKSKIEVAAVSKVNVDTNSNKMEFNQKTYPLYPYLSRQIKTESFSIVPNRDTFVKTTDGTLFYFPKNAFSAPCKDFIQIKIKPYNDNTTILLGNLQTVSNGKIIYSVGMYDVNVYCQERLLTLKKNTKYTILLPYEKTDNNSENVLGFYGERDTFGNVNWIPASRLNLNNYSGKVLDCLQKDKSCFLDPIMNVIRNIGAYRNKQKRNREIAQKRKEIANKYKGIDFAKMSSGFKEHVNYMVFQPAKMGLANCDAFYRQTENSLITQQINLNTPITKETEVKMVFKKRRILIASTAINNQSFDFSNIPKDETVYIVALQRFENNQFKLGLKQIKTGVNLERVELEAISSMDALMEKLKVIN